VLTAILDRPAQRKAVNGRLHAGGLSLDFSDAKQVAGLAC
jgi:hypothetical protein